MNTHLRTFSSLLLTTVWFILATWQPAAIAQPFGDFKVDSAMNVGNPKRSQELNRLYDQLRNTQSDIEAQGLSQAIWIIWLHHGDPKIDKLMEQALAARRESNYEKAIELFSEVIEQAPDYAEGWNQRATMYFFRQQYDESLADVAEVLKREPKHFGALIGRGIIRYRQGKSALAIQGILEALKVHPRLRERELLKELGYEEA